MQKQKSIAYPQQMTSSLSNLHSPGSPCQLQIKGNFPTTTANLKSPLSQIFQVAQKKNLHSHRNSQVDLSNLTKLIQKQKKDTPVTVQNLTSSQVNQLLQKAKEMTQHFKNNHFLLQSQKRKKKYIIKICNYYQVTHSRNESTHGQTSPNNQLTVHHAKTKSTQSLKVTQQQQQSFINYTNLKDLMQHKGKSTTLGQDQTIMISKQNFNFHFVIGIGGFGKVWKVEHKKNKQVFAMKEMSKALVITKKSVNSVMNERNLLSQLKHPFLVNMHYAFQDKENLYLVMDYMQGGDLRYHIGRQRRFSEQQTKFFIASIFCGLEHLHNNNIIQRDIKPENLVLDDHGYLRITDMGIARIMRSDNASDTSGTPGYMAPEVMYRQNHSFAVDYYALGVIAYECMLGRRPYLGRSRQEIREQILAKQVQIKKNDIPEGWTLEAADFINRLILRKPQNRLGYGGPHEVKMHPWFKQFPWSKLLNNELKSPYVPSV